MNQILCTKEYKELNNEDSLTEQEEIKKSEYSKKYYRDTYAGLSSKTVKIRRKDAKHFISMILVFLICILFSYCIYAYGVIAKTDETKKNTIMENVEQDNIDETESVLITNNNDINKIQETVYTDNYFNIEQTEYSSESGDNYSIIALLNIPSLDIKYPVLSKNSEELMEISLSKYWGAEPNEPGNCVIVGHNYRNLTHFGKLPRIEVGDEVELTDSKGRTVTYVVYDTYNVDPTDVSCTSQLTDGRTEMTLITCTNGGATRLVVRCKAIEK